MGIKILCDTVSPFPDIHLLQSPQLVQSSQHLVFVISLVVFCSFLSRAWIAASAAWHASRVSNWQRPRSPYLYFPFEHLIQGIAYFLFVAVLVGIEPSSSTVTVLCASMNTLRPYLEEHIGFEPMSLRFSVNCLLSRKVSSTSRPMLQYLYTSTI